MGKRVLPILCVSAVLQGLNILIVTGAPLVGDQEHYYLLIARLYEHNEIATTYRAPGLIWFGALVFKICGPSLVALFVAQLLLHLVCVVLIYRIAARFGCSVWQRNYVATVYAVYPTFILYSGLVLTEMIFMPVFLTFVLLWQRSQDDRSWLVAALAGAALGLASLIRPVAYLLLPFVCCMTALFDIVAGRFRSKDLLPYVVAFVAMLVVIAPWTYRNYRLCNEFVLVSSNGGEVFWSGNNTHSNGYYTPDDALADSAVNVNRYSAEERASPCFRVRFDRMASREAFEFIRGNPVRFVGLTLKKALLVLNPKRDWMFAVYWSGAFGAAVANLLPTAANTLLYLLAIAGFGRQAESQRTRRFSLIIVVYFAVTIALTFYDGRFVVPMIPFLIISSSFSVVDFRSLFARSPLGGFSRSQKVTFAAGVAFALNAVLINVFR